MAIHNLNSIISKAVALRPKFDQLPMLGESLHEFVLFVNDYKVLSGNTTTRPAENCVRATVILGEVKEGREFIDIADYWNYVCGILANQAKTPGVKVNVLFCFQYAFAVHYMRAKPRPDAYVKLFFEIQALIEELVNNSPHFAQHLLIPENRPPTPPLKNHNCWNIIERIFNDLKTIAELREKFWPHAQEGLYMMNICGGIQILNPDAR